MVKRSFVLLGIVVFLAATSTLYAQAPASGGTPNVELGEPQAGHQVQPASKPVTRTNAPTNKYGADKRWQDRDFGEAKLAEHERRLAELEKHRQGGSGGAKVVTRNKYCPAPSDGHLQREIDDLKRSIRFLKGQSNISRRDIGYIQGHEKTQDSQLTQLQKQGKKADRLWEEYQKKHRIADNSATSLSPLSDYTGAPAWQILVEWLLAASLLGLIIYNVRRRTSRRSR